MNQLDMHADEAKHHNHLKFQDYQKDTHSLSLS